MCVTAVCNNDVEYKDEQWILKPPTREQIETKLKSLSDMSKVRDTRYFLNFAWGVWCTAYARYNLFRCMINSGTNNGYNVLYCDTDSIFCIGVPDFTWYNKEVDEKLKAVCKARNLNFEYTRPKDIKGKEHPLGYFDREEDIKQFKCIHAKCYIERRLNNKLFMTISGINKGAVELLNDDIENFAPGFKFNPDAECVKKLMPTYCYNQPEVVFPDGYVSKYKYGKNLRRTGYKIDNTEEYAELLKAFNVTLDTIDERAVNKITGMVV